MSFSAPDSTLNALPELILASTSPYRRQLLTRLGLPFQTFNPRFDEQRLPAESAEQSVARLACAKAQAAHQLLVLERPCNTIPGRLVIGSDQLSVFDNNVLGKPITHEAAYRQLNQCSGKCVDFVTAIAVLDSVTHTLLSQTVRNRVWFRDLSPARIEAYLKVEQPLDCAGSFKAEGLGIALFQRIEGDDPNALIGLPLIALCSLLQAHGLDVLAAAAAIAANT